MQMNLFILKLWEEVEFKVMELQCVALEIVEKQLK